MELWTIKVHVGFKEVTDDATAMRYGETCL